MLNVNIIRSSGLFIVAVVVFIVAIYSPIKVLGVLAMVSLIGVAATKAIMVNFKKSEPSNFVEKNIKYKNDGDNNPDTRTRVKYNLCDILFKICSAAICGEVLAAAYLRGHIH